MNMEDLFQQMGGMGGGFADMFNRSRGPRRPAPQRGHDAMLNLRLSFFEAVKGVTKDLKYRSQVRCKRSVLFCHSESNTFRRYGAPPVMQRELLTEKSQNMLLAGFAMEQGQRCRFWEE